MMAKPNAVETMDDLVANAFSESFVFVSQLKLGAEMESFHVRSFGWIIHPINHNDDRTKCSRNHERFGIGQIFR